MWQTTRLKLLDWSGPVNKALDILFFLLAVLAIGSLVTQYGFYISTQQTQLLDRLDLIVVLLYVLQFLLRLIFAKNYMEFLRRHWFEALLAVVIMFRAVSLFNTLGFGLIAHYFTDLNVTVIAKLTIVSAQIAIILSLISGSMHLNRKVLSLKFHPAQTLLLSFVLVIFIGTILLLLPRATAPGKTISAIDALFTATSATCVTGLIVVDTGTHFSFLGQMIILFLIQIGGLGLMTLSSFLALFFGRGMGIKERVMMQEMMNIDRLGVINRALRLAVTLTLLFESIGALFLFFSWDRTQWSFGEHIYHSVFHAVSAFCNAGFSLNADSFMSFSQNYAAMSVIMFLIIIGGLGFVVLMDLGNIHIKPVTGHKTVRRWSVQTKLVLIVTGILLLGGTLILMLTQPFEGGMLNRFMQALFSSVTARTAGFNTVDFSMFNVPSVLLIITLMFIGASPGSTGGGIKTTTVGILFASLASIISGKNRIVLFRKSVSYTVLNRALVIFAFSIIVISVSTFFLTITEQVPLIDLFFEEVSAYATVGLSRGVTTQLSDWGRLIIILSMFIGRVGALTLAFAITPPKDKPRLEYPQEKSVMVG